MKQLALDVQPSRPRTKTVQHDRPQPHTFRSRPRHELSLNSPVARGRASIGLLPLCAATFFIVSGGPYGLEEIITGHGYARTLVLLALVPLVWSLPVALLVGELSSAIPAEGGFYAWGRRALGPAWGYQQAWISLVTSLFDMAIYPTLFVTYLGRIWPELQRTAPGQPGWWVGVLLIAACAAWNLRGSRSVGIGATVMGAALLLPFVVLIVCAAWSAWHGGITGAMDLLRRPAPAVGAPGWAAGILLCMWNYMGWDNASTVADEVRDPQRTYPRAMLGTVVLVAGCYVLTVLAATLSGLPAESWATGTWVEVARRLGGPVLAAVVVLGGALCGLGMFNVLVMSYSRLPVAMADDGLLPRALAFRSRRTGAPVVAIVVAAVMYAACLGLGLRRLVQIDVLLYGVVLVLEFAALVVLRVREPHLPRPFRVPGGIPGVVLLAVPPLLLLGVAAWAARGEEGLWGLSSMQLAVGFVALGFVAYHLQTRGARAAARVESAQRSAESADAEPCPAVAPGAQPI